MIWKALGKSFDSFLRLLDCFWNPIRKWSYLRAMKSYIVTWQWLRLRLFVTFWSLCRSIQWLNNVLLPYILVRETKHCRVIWMECSEDKNISDGLSFNCGHFDWKIRSLNKKMCHFRSKWQHFYSKRIRTKWFEPLNQSNWIKRNPLKEPWLHYWK